MKDINIMDLVAENPTFEKDFNYSVFDMDLSEKREYLDKVCNYTDIINEVGLMLESDIKENKYVGFNKKSLESYVNKNCYHLTLDTRFSNIGVRIYFCSNVSCTCTDMLGLKQTYKKMTSDNHIESTFKAVILEEIVKIQKQQAEEARKEYISTNAERIKKSLLVYSYMQRTDIRLVDSVRIQPSFFDNNYETHTEESKVNAFYLNYYLNEYKELMINGNIVPIETLDELLEIYKKHTEEIRIIAEKLGADVKYLLTR